MNIGESSTRRLAQFVAQACYSDIPSDVQETARDLVLDLLGCMMGGVNTDLGLVVKRLVAGEGEGGRAVVVGTGQRTSPLAAAYANARLANVLDFEETYMMLGHHAHCALAAPLALADTTRLDGQRLLAAFAVGYDVGARVGRYFGNPLVVNDEGQVAGWFFPGAALGVYASCASAAAALGLSPEQIEHAFGICLQYLPINAGAAWDNPARVPLSGGLPTLKYEDIGWNGKTGLMAALMAAEGITGIANVFEGADGLCKSVRPDGEPAVEALVNDLGAEWHLAKTSIKPWPSCRWFHYALTALENIVSNQQIEPSAVERVELFSAPSCCYFANPEIGSHIVMDGTFSLPHSAAMVIMGIPPGPGWYNPTTVYGDAATELRRKVSVGVEPTARQPAAWGLADGVVRVPSRAVIHADGKRYEAESAYAFGDPWDGVAPFTKSDLQAKFCLLGRSLAPPSQKWENHVEAVMRTVGTLEEVPAVTDLVAHLSPLA